MGYSEGSSFCRDGKRLRGRLTALLLLVIVLELLAPAYAIAAPPEATDATATILVKFRSAADAATIAKAIATVGGQTVRDLPQIRTRVIDVPTAERDKRLAAYAAHASVERAEPARQFAMAGMPNDPGYAQQWALPKIAWDQAYGVVAISGTAKIAVLDTGVDATHPDLAGRIAPGTSYVGGNAGVDPNGHGTALAGIAAANVNNGIGMAGVAYAGASLASVQVLQSDGTGTDASVVPGVLWAADNGATVILMGFSSPDFSASLQDAVNYAWSKGAVIVAATGNDGLATPTYPAGMANVIGVAATDESDAVGARSNTASASVGAPGVGVYATQAGGGYATVTGTSAAAAETAGLAALLMASGKTSSAASTQIRGATDPVTGQTFGRINVAKALGAAVTAPVTVPGPTPTPGPGPIYRAGVQAKVDLEAWKDLTSPAGWSGTTLNNGDHDYNDGDVIPFRLALNGLNAGSSWSLTIQYDFSNGTRHFIDSLASFNQTVLLSTTPLGSAQACAGRTCTSGPDNTKAIPTDTVCVAPGSPANCLPAGAQIAGNFTVYNGSITTAGTYSTATVAGNIVKQITLSGTVAGTTGTKDVLILFGGHLARENEWGVANGAASFTGASGKMFMVNFTGGTGSDADEHISINLTGIAKQADLMIVKMRSPATVNSGENVTYTITVTNNGPDQATSVTVTDTLASNSTLVSATASPGTCGTPPVTCSLGPINAGGSGTVTIVVQLSNTGTADITITNTASVSGSPTDPNTANNTSAPVSTTVKRPNSPPTIAKDNASVTVNEGQTAANGGPYSDPNGDTVTITASVGTVTKTGTSSGTWSWSFVTTDGPAQSQTVTITANDGHGGTTTTTFGLTVNNVAPTATFAATSPINEGSSSAVDFTSPSDPSSVDTAAGFHYAFSCTNGSLAAATYAAAGPSPSTSCAFADNGLFTVKGRIIDKDDGFTEYTAAVTVNNVAPTVSTTTVAPEPSVVGQSATATATFSDPGTHDAPFSCTVNYGDGSGALSGTVSGNTCTGPAHTYATAGSFTVTVSVTDKDGGTGSASTSHVVNKATPTLTTTPQPSTGRVGVILNDSATLSGGFNPKGTITFHLFDPTQTTCDFTPGGNPVTPRYNQTITVTGNGTYTTSPGFKSDMVGTWRWTVFYTGDANNNSASSGCGAENVTVTK